MSKTIKQVADDLKINKQKLYRYIKRNHINDVHQVKSVIYIDDALERTLKSIFLKSSASFDVHQNHINDTSNDAEIINLLKKELEKSHKRNEHLQKLLENQQVLTLKAQEKVEILESKKEYIDDDEEKKKRKWIFWK